MLQTKKGHIEVEENDFVIIDGSNFEIDDLVDDLEDAMESLDVDEFLIDVVGEIEEMIESGTSVEDLEFELLKLANALNGVFDDRGDDSVMLETELGDFEIFLTDGLGKELEPESMPKKMCMFIVAPSDVVYKMSLLRKEDFYVFA